eukprot:2076502-Rhodomonas_salina.1
MAVELTILAVAAVWRGTRLGKAEARYKTAISLRACYAMSGTDIGYIAIGLRTCYAMSGTELAYATCPVRCPVLRQRTVVKSAMCLRACYAMSGTDMAYAATCLPVL